ncbi:MAG: nicotinate-nucleotide--dimethylbenzimidazole phosphoribosyltransferase [Bernardetiaceae bacterium]|nr:nicotinate-nucleotide--dimethylbenzimidazole phosphoribosyltransferase [Bernardetiaceae bacterium]
MIANFKTRIQHKIDTKTKPLGALGQLEDLALQIASIQQSENPTLKRPAILVFAADHGAATEGISAYPQEVTAQMVLNFLNDGAAINVFCNQNHINLEIIDAGVNYDFEPHTKLIHAKIAKATKNYLKEKAMSDAQLELCLQQGAKRTQIHQKLGTNIIGFGEMGIGNTASASLIMHGITQIPIENCIGSGTGLQGKALEHKVQILKKALEIHHTPQNPKDYLMTFGGFEIAQITGAMLEAYHQNMIILVDGFIATVAYLVATTYEAKIHNNAIFCHQSQEKGHAALLDYLNATPILNLNLRLGEGTGCALAYPIISSAVQFLNQMASFETAKVAQKLI